MIFDESIFLKLRQLSLVASKVRAGAIKGERRSTKRGTSIEFADYRDYTPGDDLRRLDWNIFARLERPFVKLLEEEEDLAVHILVDASRSMDWGEGQYHKLNYALHLAAALGAIALGSGDRLSVVVFPGLDPARQFGPARGAQHLIRLLRFLEEQNAAGTTDLDHILQEYARAALRPGLAFLLSDLFSPPGFQKGLNQLLSRGYEVSLLHLLSPEELDPPLSGDLRLVDVETGSTIEASINAGLRDLYNSRLKAWLAEIQHACRGRNIRYMHLSTAQAWDRVVLFEMRQAGMVK